MYETCTHSTAWLKTVGILLEWQSLKKGKLCLRQRTGNKKVFIAIFYIINWTLGGRTIDYFGSVRKETLKKRS